jgi:hypothetical protein
VVVEVGLIVVEPERLVDEKVPGVIAMDDAFEAFHESTVEESAAICEGDALKEEIVGGMVVLEPPPAALNAATCISHGPLDREPVAA